MRYAKGFIHTAEAISVGQSGTFRYRLIGLWGIRRYYQKRKGETLLSPTEQQQVIAIARNLGLQRTEYFDAYVEEYDFTWQLRSPHMITPVTPNGNFIYTTR